MDIDKKGDGNHAHEHVFFPPNKRNTVMIYMTGWTMPIHRKYVAFLGALALASSFLQAMVFDNRFIPLLKGPRLALDNTDSFFSSYLMAGTASSSFDERQNDIGLPEIFGEFDLVALAKAMVLAGKPNPLRSDLREGKLLYALDGSMQMQGIAFEFNQQINEWLCTGGSWAFMRVNAHDRFKLKQTNSILGASDPVELDEMRRAAFCAIGLDAGNSAQLGFADIEWYLRFGKKWDYTLKFRHIDAGLSLGILIPSAQRRNIGKLSSIPMGAEGRWGAYIAGDALFELKEDFKIGLYTQISKRFAKTQRQRMPVDQEGPLFGVIVADAYVNPAPTLVFEPYVMLEHLRDGLGACVQYTLTWHGRDHWKGACCDLVTCDGKPIPLNLSRVEGLSQWTSEYFTLNVFYDFGKVKLIRDFDPILAVRWDIPSKFFIAQRVYKTQRVCIELTFAY